MSDKQAIRTMAFAAICQAAHLVQQVSRTGTCEDESLRQTLSGILVTDPESPQDVFGGSNLKEGYKAIVAQLGHGSSPKNAELTRYVVSLIALERKLSGRRDVLNMLGERISQVKRQLHHFDLLDEQVLANLASIYSEHISPIGPRIQVAGTPVYLQQPLGQHKGRALLLAGIPATVLWRQAGGRRRHILFSRGKMVASARSMLNQI